MSTSPRMIGGKRHTINVDGNARKAMRESYRKTITYMKQSGCEMAYTPQPDKLKEKINNFVSAHYSPNMGQTQKNQMLKKIFSPIETPMVSKRV